LYACKFSIIELFKHKEKIIKYAQLSSEEILEVYYSVLKKVSVYDEETITGKNIETATELCKGIDEKDMIFVATTLELDGELWTGDVELKEKLKAKGFTKFYTPTLSSEET
jgi:predicted nucleic acid-binding protein